MYNITRTNPVNGKDSAGRKNRTDNFRSVIIILAYSFFSGIILVENILLTQKL